MGQERREYLDSLRGREEELWIEVDEWIQQGKRAAYRKAAALLADLRELSADEEDGQFDDWFAELLDDYSRRKALREELDKAGLFAPMERGEPLVAGVGLEQWRRLYEAALRFRDEAPWSWLYEDDNFAIHWPESPWRRGYISVMGASGEFPSLMVYLGDEGFSQFLHIRKHLMEAGSGSSDVFMLVEIPSLMASFGEPGELGAEDLQVIEALGLGFSKREAWPLFRSVRPGYDAWRLEAAEVELLTLALEQGLEVALQMREDPGMKEPWPEKGEMLVRAAHRGEGEGWRWGESWGSFIPEPVTSFYEHLLPQEAIEEWRALPRLELFVELDFFLLPMGLTPSAQERPKSPYLWLCVEEDSGEIASFGLVTLEQSWKHTLSQLPLSILSQLAAKLGGLPRALLLSSSRLTFLMSPLCQALDIELEWVPVLEQLEAAKLALLSLFQSPEAMADLLARPREG